jgi:lysophospholipid acyltransferase
MDLVNEILTYSLDCWHLLAATAMTYIFIKYFGRRYSAIWILTLTVMHLSYLHIRRMYYDYGGWKLDVSTIYMMSICKFSSIAFSYEDGAKDDSMIKSSYHREK